MVYIKCTHGIYTLYNYLYYHKVTKFNESLLNLKEKGLKVYGRQD